MGTNEREFVPFMAVHPTEIIKDELRARGISRKEFAELMGMQQSNVSRLLKGEDITLKTAQKLETALGIPCSDWLALQSQYNRDVVNIAKRDEVEKVAKEQERQISYGVAMRFLYERLGLVDRYTHQKLSSIDEALGFSLAADNGMFAACFKRSDKLQTDQRNQNAWLLLAYIRGRKAPKGEYRHGEAQKAAKEIAGMANSGHVTEEEIGDILGAHGITYGCEPKIDKVPIDAVAMMVDGHPAIITTHRHNDMSRLIFDVLHELGHIELHMGGKSNEWFVSADRNTRDAKTEEEANKFAEDALIPPPVWSSIMGTASKTLRLQTIAKEVKKQAKVNGVNDRIALWRWKHESGFFAVKGTSPDPIV